MEIRWGHESTRHPEASSVPPASGIAMPRDTIFRRWGSADRLEAVASSGSSEESTRLRHRITGGPEPTSGCSMCRLGKRPVQSPSGPAASPPRCRKSDGFTHAATSGPGWNTPGSSSASCAIVPLGSATRSGYDTSSSRTRSLRFSTPRTCRLCRCCASISCAVRSVRSGPAARASPPASPPPAPPGGPCR